jgi:hypothetical protein
MNQSVNNNGKNLQQLWQERVKKCEGRSGTIQAFCETEGISAARLGYWQKKFRQRKGKASPVGISPFAQVAVQGSSTLELVMSKGMSSLPDPKWAADFVRYLMMTGMPS